jgi:hypothetical protein
VTSRRRAPLISFVVAIGAVAACMLPCRVAIGRNHPESYLVSFELATALAEVRARSGPWPARLALGLSSLLQIVGARLNFAGARMPA